MAFATINLLFNKETLKTQIWNSSLRVFHSLWVVN